MGRMYSYRKVIEQMSNIQNSNISGYLEIKIKNDPEADNKLKKMVLSSLEMKYRMPLPEIIEKRVQEKLDTSTRFGYAPIYLAHREIIQSAENYDFPFYLIGANGASLINYALGITKINPLQPHYRCETCKHVEFVADEQIDTGLLLPDKNCPECGHKMLGDGQNLRVESFLGYRHDRGPSLALGVPSGRFEDAVTYMERMFHAKQKDIHRLDFPIEEGYLFIYVDIVPIDKLFADKKVFPFSEMDDPTVFGYLSQPEAFDCYLPYEPDIPIIKELLECIEINHYSDLFKICGLIHSSAWLPYILPSIRNGSVKYRKTITAREDIYHHLLKHRIDPETAYKVMEMTRKGRASKLFEDKALHQLLLEHGVSEEYIKDLKSIKYLVTQAQARELAMIAYKSAWRKLYDK